jgi:polar amino acid transport system substrate-binding protein
MLLLVLAAPLARAEPEPPTQAAPVRFSIAEVSPWGYLGPHGEPTGLLVELAELLGRESGVPVEINMRPTVRVLADLAAGDADFSILFDSPMTERSAQRVASVVSMAVLVVGERHAVTVATVQELHGRRVGFIRGAWYGDAISANPEIRLVPMRDVEHGLAMLAARRVEYLVLTAVAASALPELDPDQRYRVMTELPGVSGSLYVSPKTSRTQARAALAAAVEQLMENGEIKRIFSRRYRMPPIP